VFKLYEALRTASSQAAAKDLDKEMHRLYKALRTASSQAAAKDLDKEMHRLCKALAKQELSEADRITVNKSGR
jgi:flagellar hook-length control protein FliK